MNNLPIESRDVFPTEATKDGFAVFTALNRQGGRRIQFVEGPLNDDKRILTDGKLRFAVG